MQAAITQAIKLKMPYCVSFKEIPDQPSVIRRIIEELKTKKAEVLQLELLRKNIIKQEIPTVIKKNTDANSDDEDYEGANLPKLN